MTLSFDRIDRNSEIIILSLVDDLYVTYKFDKQRTAIIASMTKTKVQTCLLTAISILFQQLIISKRNGNNKTQIFN